MAQAIERRYSVQAWAASIALHGVAMTIVGLLLSPMRPLPLQETFQWNVSLVSALQEQSAEPRSQPEEPLRSASQPQVRPKEHMVAASKTALQNIQDRQPSPVVQSMSDPAVVQQHQKAVAQVEATPVKEVARIQEAQQVKTEPHPITQSVVSEASSRHTDVAAPVSHSVEAVGTASAVETKEPADTGSMAETVTAASATEKAVPMTAEPGADSQRLQMTALPGSSEVPQARTARLDYGWLIESLGTRLAELKRYPAMARNNGLEGKVLLRAMIRADGQLTEVSVQKSSGHEELDAAAMQTMRDASPLKLYQELGRAQIAITVPLVYTLAR